MLPITTAQFEIKSISSILFWYQTTTYLEPHAISRTYPNNLFLFHRAIFTSRHFISIFLSSRLVDITVIAHFWYADVMISKKRKI